MVTVQANLRRSLTSRRSPGFGSRFAWYVEAEDVAHPWDSATDDA